MNARQLVDELEGIEAALDNYEDWRTGSIGDLRWFAEVYAPREYGQRGRAIFLRILALRRTGRLTPEAFFITRYPGAEFYPGFFDNEQICEPPA